MPKDAVISLAVMPYDVIRAIVSHLTVKDAYEFAKCIYFTYFNQEDKKTFFACVFNTATMEGFFKRDFPESYVYTSRFAPKVPTEKTDLNYEEKYEAKRQYWSRQYAEMRKLAYADLTENQIKIFDYVATNDLDNFKKIFDDPLFSMDDIEHDKSVYTFTLFKGGYDLIGLASIKKHQEILDVFYKKALELAKKHDPSLIRIGSELFWLAVVCNQHELLQKILADQSIQFCLRFFGYRLLCLASQFGHSETLQCVITHLTNAKININIITQQKTPLDHACEHGQLQVAKILIDNGAEINEKSRFVHIGVIPYGENTPLHFASKNGHLNIVQLLIDKGADINNQEQSITDETPLHLASKSGHLNVLRYLCEKKADVNKGNYKSETPLHLASRRGDTEMVELLLKYGANPSARAIFFNTPLDYATSEETVTLLEKSILHHQKVKPFIQRVKNAEAPNKISFAFELFSFYLEKEYSNHHYQKPVQRILDVIKGTKKNTPEEKIQEIRDKIGEEINKIKDIRKKGTFYNLCQFILNKEFEEEFSKIQCKKEKKEITIGLLHSYTDFRFFQRRKHRPEANALINNISEETDSKKILPMIQTAKAKLNPEDNGGFRKTLEKIELRLMY